MNGLLESLSTLGYLGVFTFSLALNLVPFVGPSNLVLAGAAGSIFPSLNPVLIGFLIALGSSIAKTIHFGLSFLVGNFVKRKQKAEANGKSNESKHISHRYAMVALFLAAATPIPDDPIVIPLGLAGYSPIRFFLAYFAGKATITVAGAYFGQRFGLTLEEYLGQDATIIISVILTTIITVVIIKKDIILKRLKAVRPPRKQ